MQALWAWNFITILKLILKTQYYASDNKTCALSSTTNISRKNHDQK